jgi:peptidoglycan LD-endopeptidase LytH
MLLKIQLCICLLLSGLNSSCQPSNSKNSHLSFNELLVEIREESISPKAAQKEFQRILKGLHETYRPAKYDSLSMNLVFPLKRKNYKSVGGKGRGFYGRQFDLFDHSVAKSHPAHDIFIYDLNKDCKDDTEQDYVDVLAVNNCVVIATESNWTEEMGYKGGNYVWLYDLESGGLWYYAHQRKVYVVVDQFVNQGDKIGEVGRTGFNAKTNRSDTHLHLMFLKIDEDFNPTPVNHYPWLTKAKTVYEAALPTHYPRKGISASFIPVPSLEFVNTIFNSNELGFFSKNGNPNIKYQNHWYTSKLKKQKKKKRRR